MAKFEKRSKGHGEQTPEKLEEMSETIESSAIDEQPIPPVNLSPEVKPKELKATEVKAPLSYNGKILTEPSQVNELGPDFLRRNAQNLKVESV